MKWYEISQGKEKNEVKRFEPKIFSQKIMRHSVFIGLVVFQKLSNHTNFLLLPTQCKTILFGIVRVTFDD